MPSTIAAMAPIAPTTKMNGTQAMAAEMIPNTSDSTATVRGSDATGAPIGSGAARCIATGGCSAAPRST
ncbi:MAG: hypothetical protein HZB15_05770 [Actinobacteria bacterium]|nr:hypothetical protein [Actinomycetota bacterium]